MVNSDSSSKDTITARVRVYLSKHPSLQECLSLGLINYSALARRICNEEQLPNFQGVVVACRRLALRTRDRGVSMNAAHRVLAHAHISVVNQISVAVIARPIEQQKLAELKTTILSLRGEINIIEGRDRVTMVFSDRFNKTIKAALGSKLKKVTSGLAQITIVFDERFESTSGVVANIYSRLAMERINIREEMSCSTDLHLVVDAADAAKAAALISSYQAEG